MSLAHDSGPGKIDGPAYARSVLWEFPVEGAALLGIIVINRQAPPCQGRIITGVPTSTCPKSSSISKFHMAMQPSVQL